MTSTLLALFMLAQVPATETPAPTPQSSARAPRRWHVLTRLEASALALLPQGAREEGYAQLTPTLVVDDGAEFGLWVGAPVRLRLGGGEAGAWQVRPEDWDSLSDWGQLVQTLKLGSDSSPVGLWVGALEEYSLVSAHLVRRYSNRTNPNYHPAGAFLNGSLGPLYVEAFTSDVLGARLMGTEVEVDVAYLLSGEEGGPGRYTLALSAVQEWGRAGGDSPPVTLAHADAAAVWVVQRGLELHLLAGAGGRAGSSEAWGAVVGLGVDALTRTLDMRLRVEGRQQRGGFRQGFFGPDYELARLQAVGPAGLPVVAAPFPEGYSAYSELKLGWDGERLGGLVQRHLNLSVGAEVYDWGRVDVDGRLGVQLADRSLELALSGLALGVGQPGARYLYSGQVRWRLAGALYVLGQGGTLLFPTAAGELRPGAYASLGVGVDNAR